jgi:hypothetical protein
LVVAVAALMLLVHHLQQAIHLMAVMVAQVNLIQYLDHL